ncbi:SCF ubiquitin ligase complex subunit cdc4, partial [Blyttiomyces sp. JEL0837]
TVVTTTTTKITEFPPLVIKAPPRLRPLDAAHFPLANTPTPPALKKFCFDLNGVPTRFKELDLFEQDVEQLNATSPGVTSSSVQSIQFATPSSSHHLRQHLKTVSASHNEFALPPEAISSVLDKSTTRKSRKRTRDSLVEGVLEPAGSGVNEFETTNVGSTIFSAPAGSSSKSASPTHVPQPASSSSSSAVAVVNNNSTGIDSPASVLANVLAAAGNPSDMITATGASLPNLSDIASIITTFDALPNQLQSYLLLQLLRRCPAPTLQFVSSLILPTLKRDFLGQLPVELGYLILRYLDLRSVGRCAAVSSRWRRVVDGDGAEVAVWKRRLILEKWWDEAEVKEEILDYLGKEAAKSVAAARKLAATGGAAGNRKRKAIGGNSGFKVPMAVTPMNGKGKERHVGGGGPDEDVAMGDGEGAASGSDLSLRGARGSNSSGAGGTAHRRRGSLSSMESGATMMRGLGMDEEGGGDGDEVEGLGLSIVGGGRRSIPPGHPGGLSSSMITTRSSSSSLTLNVSSPPAEVVELDTEGTTGRRRRNRQFESGDEDAEDLEDGGDNDDVIDIDGDMDTVSISGSQSPATDAAIASAVTATISAATESISQLGISRVASQAPHLYKNLYRRHHRVRQNWLYGRHKTISFPGHGNHVVTCLQFDADKIVSGSDDMTVHIYDTNSGRLRRKLEGHEGGVWALQYYGDALVSGSTDRTVRVWDLDSGRCTHLFEGHTSTVRCLMIVPPSSSTSGSSSSSSFGSSAFAKKGGASSSSSAKAGVKGLKDADFPVIAGVKGLKDADFPVIVTGSRDATLRVWRLPNPKTDPPYRAPGGQGGNVGAGAGNAGAAVAAGAGGATGGPQGGVGNNSSPPSPDANNSGHNPYFMHVLNGHTNSVRAIAGHGRVLVSGSYDSTVRVWDLVTGEPMHVFRGHREKVYSVGYCHELERAVSGSMDFTVKVWCVKDGVLLFNLEGHTSLVGLLEVSPEYLISAAADASLRVWSPTTGQCLATLQGHSAAITCFHHDPNLNRIVSGSDGGVKIWELSSAAPGGSGTGNGFVGGVGAGVGPGFSFTQGPNGPQPVYGRFVRDLVSNVQGVWRVRMDERRLVSAMQKEGGQTWFEVLDFGELVEPGSRVDGPGDEEWDQGGSDFDDDDDGDDGNGGGGDGDTDGVGEYDDDNNVGGGGAVAGESASSRGAGSGAGTASGSAGGSGGGVRGETTGSGSGNSRGRATLQALMQSQNARGHNSSSSLRGTGAMLNPMFGGTSRSSASIRRRGSDPAVGQPGGSGSRQSQGEGGAGNTLSTASSNSSLASSETQTGGNGQHRLRSTRSGILTTRLGGALLSRPRGSSSSGVGLSSSTGGNSRSSRTEGSSSSNSLLGSLASTSSQTVYVRPRRSAREDAQNGEGNEDDDEEEEEEDDDNERDRWGR